MNLTNNFHNTSVSVAPVLTKAQVKRAWRTLCGHADCMCGGEAGERGGQWRVVSPDGKTFYVELSK